MQKIEKNIDIISSALAAFPDIKFDTKEDESLHFNSFSLSRLRKILKLVESSSYVLDMKQPSMMAAELPLIEDIGAWDFEKGVWKDHNSIHKSLSFPDPLYVFGYGSLCWNVAPELKTSKAFPVYVKGFRRRFWQMSSDHRGTADFPGLVVSLIPDEEYERLMGFTIREESQCFGLAFEISNGEEKRVIEALDFREKGGYVRKRIKMYDCENGKEIEGIAYIGESRNPHFAKKELREDIFECARIIARSKGPSGRNSEYLYNLNDFLEGNGFKDSYISNLAGLVKQTQNSKEVNKEELIGAENLLDFSLVFTEAEEKLSIWIWEIVDLKKKKSLFEIFASWLALRPYPFISRYSEEFEKKGIEIPLKKGNLKEAGQISNFFCVVEHFNLLMFENT